MNFNELKAALLAEVARQRAPTGSQTLAKALPSTGQQLAKARRVVSVSRCRGRVPLLKALGEAPHQNIKDAAVDSAARRREVPNTDQLLGGGKREYRLVYGGSSLSEEEARAACARALMDSRVTADEAVRIEHCLTEHRTMPVALVAKLF